uniref:Uncharacterized protein n=1 Tax=Arundo donax TaxID=35708 RepID=A0A0A8YLV2_ARUDO
MYHFTTYFLNFLLHLGLKIYASFLQGVHFCWVRS